MSDNDGCLGCFIIVAFLFLGFCVYKDSEQKRERQAQIDRIESMLKAQCEAAALEKKR